MAVASRKGLGVTVKITPSIQKLHASLRRWQYGKIPQLSETEYRRLLNAAVSIMKKEAPSRTGALKQSIAIKTRSTSGGRRDKRYHGRVGPSVFYAQFVERGTGPSPGRFIPAIEKRVRDGTHPGTPRNPFVQRTIDKLNLRARSSGKNIGRVAKKSLRLR